MCINLIITADSTIMVRRNGGNMELGILIAAGILSTLALLMSCTAMVMMIARDKATHTVQLVPVDEEINRANEEYMNKWSTSDDAINDQNKRHQEHTEEEMPEFTLDDEDKEIFSI